MKIILDSSIDIKPDSAVPITNYQDYLLNILINVGYHVDKPPVGDLLRNFHGLDGNWLVVSPINWQATHNDSMLVAAGYAFSLSQQQSEFVFNVFSEFVASEGMQLYMHDTTTWLLKAQDKNIPVAKPVYSILHRSLMSELANLDDSLYWQKFITMSQMLLSNLQLPGEKGLYPVNGVWVWGEGYLQDSKSTQIIALDEISLRFAKILSNKACSYTDNLAIKKDAIFIGSSKNSLQNLPDKLLQKINYWYWNNKAYKLQSKSKIFKAIKCVFNKKK